MAVKVGTLLADLLTKAGVDTTKPEFASVLAIAAELPDEAATELNTKLLTVEAARSNPALKSHFHAQVLNGIDKTVEEAMDEHQFSDAVKAEIKALDSANKRVAAVGKKVKELTEAAANAKLGDKAELAKTVDTLHAQLKAEKDGRKKFEQDLKDQQEASLTDSALESLYRSVQYAGEAPLDVNVMTAKNLVALDMKGKGIRALRDANDNNNLKLVRDDGSDYHDENHNKVRVSDYVSKLLGTNKLLKVTDPKKQQPGNPPPSPFVPQGEGKSDHSRVVSAIDQQLQEIKAAGNGLGH